MHNEIRKGVTQAVFNEKASNVLFGEVAIISIFLGFYFTSWWIFGITLIGLIVVLAIQPLAKVFAIILSLLWAIIGWYIGRLFGSLGASFVIAFLGLAVSGGYHISALQWMKDNYEK